MLKKYPILIIDDDSDDQELLGEITTEIRPGTSIHNFNNGAQALKYLQTTDEQPFIILSDVNMPMMTGLELLEIIQNTPFLKEKSIPFVLLSTSGDKRYVRRAYQLNVQGFFQKPSDLKELRNILRITFEFWEKCLHPHHPMVEKERD
jgi:CheY-like chemotaxis protein